MISKVIIASIKVNLENTKLWCEKYFDPNNIQKSLRTEELNPNVDFWHINSGEQKKSI